MFDKIISFVTAQSLVFQFGFFDITLPCISYWSFWVKLLIHLKAKQILTQST